MKITVVGSPALCLWPLIEAQSSTVKGGAVRMERRFDRALLRIVTKAWNAITARVLVGYEDGTGFHQGATEAPLPVIKTGRILNRPPGQACLQARWKKMRTPNFDSGRRLVLEWDSSSLPPCQPLPGSFLTKFPPRYTAATGKCPPSFTGTRRTGRSVRLDFHAGRWSRSSTFTSTRSQWNKN